MLNISANTLNILQFKDIAVQPFITIQSTNDYTFNLSTDADLFSDETEDTPTQSNTVVYPLIQKLPSIRQNIDITKTRMFSVGDLKISVLDTKWDNFRFSEVIKDNPIYNQPLKYFLWPRTVSFADKILMYEGFVTNIRKQGNYIVLTVKDDAGVSDKMIPRKKVNQSEMEFNSNHGKPIPFAYGECNAYALLTDLDDQDMNCQCDTKDQYQNIKQGPENLDETTQVLKISSTEEGYYRIRDKVTTPSGSINDLIIGGWCSPQVKQYENKPWGCTINGKPGSPFRYNTLFSSYRATSLGGGSFSQFIPDNATNFKTYDGVFNDEGYGIKYRPASIQGLEELNNTDSGYVYMENYNAENSTGEFYNYGVSNQQASGVNDYRIGLNINLTQPTLTKALSNRDMTAGIHVTFEGDISAGFTNTGDENQQQFDTGKLISFRVNKSETYDSGDDVATINPISHQHEIIYNASSPDGIGYSSQEDSMWGTGMTEVVQKPIEGLYIDIKETPGSPFFPSAMWLAVSYVIADYRFFFEDIRGENFFIETKGRVDTQDYKYTGGNQVMTAYSTEQGRTVMSIVRYVDGNKKIPVQVAYNRSRGINRLSKILPIAINMNKKRKTITSPGIDTKKRLTKKEYKGKLEILDNKSIIKTGSTNPKKAKY